MLPTHDPPAIGRLADISAVEDSTLNVSCPVTPGNPAATNVSWTTNENKIISTSKELYIHQIKRKDDGFYKCLAVNKMNPSCENETEGEVSRSFHLNVVYKTTVTSLYVKGKHGLDPVTLRENDSLELVCQTESNPKSSITIYFKDVILISQSNVNTLTYSKATASCSNDGIYTCVGRNIHNEKDPSRNHLTLHILCSPRPSPAVDLQEHIFTSERKTVVLTFVALAHPAPTKAGFKWLKEQQKSIWIYLQESDRFHIVTSGLQTNLTISNVSEKDLGNYRLTIENSIGIYDQSFHVLNEVPPAKPTHFVIIDDSLTNSSATLSWKPFKGYDKEQIFILQYKKETFQQFTTINITDNGGLEMNHTIMNLLSGTRYLVQISVANGFGRSDNVTLRFQTKSKPASFEELIVIEQSVTETSLTVQWKPGNDGGDKQLFEINYKKTDSEEWTLLLTDDMETSDYMIRQYIGGLERGSTYQLYLMATNTYGNSDKSEIIEFQTKRSNSCQCKVTQSFIIWILAGLLAAITLAVISVTSTICLRRKYFCRRLADEDSITSKQDRMKANSSKEIYEEIKQETGTEMVNLRQKYERLDTPEKGDSSNSKLVIYEDIHIPTEIGGEKENKMRAVDGYEVPAAFSDKNKLIRKKEDDDKSTGKNTNFTEYVNLEL
ncbi:uncharacterized protein LOC132748462 isoform X2 [Ruditapes philippinarum]|uniref:uncharacterized protein LOC132748462 isoform X2 n=1 Tax=Ruditapes philippinarum TaxID=129788 RepID=UPI00295AFF28|nr:uncharacterized protein LOC132748462 isoform X2 [Ruditapes philippinarum]